MNPVLKNREATEIQYIRNVRICERRLSPDKSAIRRD